MFHIIESCSSKAVAANIVLKVHKSSKRSVIANKTKKSFAPQREENLVNKIF
jgi:hypothetical protein